MWHDFFERCKAVVWRNLRNFLMDDTSQGYA